MNETTLLTVFVAVTSIAVVLQMLILAGMYFVTRQTAKRVEELSSQVLPLVAKVRGIVDETAPKLSMVTANLVETSTLIRAQAQHIDKTVSEIVEQTKVQANRADRVATRTMERVDITAAAVQHAVLSPIRHASGLVEGILAGMAEFVGGRKARQASKAVPKDEMFI